MKFGCIIFENISGEGRLKIYKAIFKQFLLEANRWPCTDSAIIVVASVIVTKLNVVSAKSN